MEVSKSGVYISYAWGGEREEIVNQLDQALQRRSITIIRDKRDLGYKGSITDFMKEIGRGLCVIIVVSDKYLRSPNCMFELVEIADNKQFHDRIFPIVLTDATIYDPVKRIEYLKYWEGKRSELVEAIKSVDPANLQGVREDIDNYDRFRDRISGLASTLKDMNTLTPEIHKDSDFEVLFTAIEKRLNEVEAERTIMSNTEPSSSGTHNNQKATNFFNQSGQTINGDQKNIVGDYHDNRVIAAETYNEGTKNIQQPLDPAVLGKMFDELNQVLEKLEAGFQKEIAQKSVQELKIETEKGDKADEGKTEAILKFLFDTAPDAWEVAVTTLVNPIAGISTVFKKVAERAKAEQNRK